MRLLNELISVTYDLTKIDYAGQDRGRSVLFKGIQRVQSANDHREGQNMEENISNLAFLN